LEVASKGIVGEHLNIQDEMGDVNSINPGEAVDSYLLHESLIPERVNPMLDEAWSSGAGLRLPTRQ
jgi:hypothetical protein